MATKMKGIVGRVSHRPVAHAVIDRHGRGKIAIVKYDRSLDNDRLPHRASRRDAARSPHTDRVRAPRKLQAMHLTDYSVASDISQHPCDL